MNFLLKIVEGPNKGAEIALVEGVSVTLGKTDDCDVILADPTLPDAPLEVSATADSVLVGGVPLEPFTVRTVGSTGIAVGPSDAPWGPLVWKSDEEASSQNPEVESQGGPAAPSDGNRGPSTASDSDGGGSTARRSNGETAAAPGRRRRYRGCLVAAIAILLILLILCLVFRKSLHTNVRDFYDRTSVKWRSGGGGEVSAVTGGAQASSGFAIEKLADRYGLTLEEDNGRAKLSGNFATRAERLKATEEAYAARPGIDLDFSDDESFRTAAEDSLFTLTEGAIMVTVATNRFLHLAGTSESPLALKKTLESLNTYLPKLRDVDASGIKLATLAATPAAQRPNDPATPRANGSTVRRQVKPAQPVLPVCSILTTPYACLVMRDGRRILEGGAIGDATILSIAADEVTVTNSAGRFTWKP